MPAEAAGAANAGGGRRAGNGIVGAILRMVFMWYIMSWFKGGNKQGGNMAKDPQNFSFPKFQKGSFVDMYCFLSEKPSIRHYDMADLIWSETGIPLAMPDARTYTYVYEPSQAVQKNGSVYLHVAFVKAGHSINPLDPGYEEDAVFGQVYSLIGYYPPPKNDTGVKLLSGDALPEPTPKGAADIAFVSYLKPNVTIQMVDHFIVYPKTGVPPQIAPFLQLDEQGNYFPVIYFNEFWLLRDKMLLMNETVTNVTLHLELGHVSTWWWQMMMQMDKSFDMQKTMGLQQEGEADEFKRILLEGNPYLLGLTMVVSLLHTVFDLLAFKNDIGFWKNNKSMEGLSARSVIINAVCQLIILLYLIDNETSFVVLLSSFLGTGIEFWKVTKAMNLEVDWTKFPYVKLSDRASYSENKTKQYDAEATRYLSYVLYPLVIGYAIYSLLYKTHKSWYSWILNSLVGAVYMFGFILMCPQLYLNYKLKSVAHLPWRQMTYKFLNTIIDDLFAFVIKMPTLHRLSVFRDDIIFLIFLYQRWIYRVDKTRVNEFGWAPEGPLEQEQAAMSAADAAAPTALEGTDGVANGSAATRRRKDATGSNQEAKASASSGQNQLAASPDGKKDK